MSTPENPSLMRQQTLEHTAADGRTAAPPLPGDSAAKMESQALVPAPKGRHHWVMLVVILLLIIIAAVTASYLTYGGRYQSTNDAYTDGRVIRISPRVSGPVIQLDVDDNTPVKAGDVLLVIDPADYQAKVDQAAAALESARSSVQQAKAVCLSADADVGEASAALKAAQTEAAHRESDYHRYSAMGTDGISEQQLETARSTADSADDQRDAAAKKLTAAEAQLNVTKTNVETAESQVSAAEAELHFTQLQLQYTRIIAPTSGKITNRNVEVGAFVSTGQPLFAIVPDETWIVANFKEVQLEHMKVGQRASVSVDAYPDLHLRAHIESLQAGTGSRFELLPPENATGNWVKVVQRLPVKLLFDADQAGLDRLAQGMSVEVNVDTESQ
jgi:membrane fusion protein (multidrug efflux system)